MGEVPIVISTLVYSLPWVTAAYLAVGVRMAVQGGGKEFHPFSLVMGAAALYSFGYFLELQASNLETLVLVRDFELAGAISLPAVTFLFLADLAGVRVGPGAKAGLAAISLVLWLFLVSNPLHGLFYPQVGIRFGAFTVPVTVKGPVYFLFLAWVGIFLVGSTFLLIRSFRRTKDPRRRRTLRFVLVALQILWVPVVLILAGLDTVLDPVPPTILVLCLHFLAHEVRHDLFEIQVRRWRQAFLGVEEAAFLTDGTRTVVGANAPADRILTALGLGPQVSTLPPELELEEGGQTRWFATSQNLYDSRRRLTSWLLIDVTDRRRAEQALQASEQKYRRLVENSLDIVYTLDREGVFLFVSPAWTNLLGHPVSDVVGKSFIPFVHPTDVPACQAFLDRITGGQTPLTGVEYRVLHAQGHWVWHSSTAGPLRDGSDAIVGLEGTSRDITQKKEDESRIRALLDEKDLILKEVHHRIKNNMGNVMGLLTLQAMELKEPAAVEALRDASGRVQSMMVLYDKLYRSEDYAGVSTAEYFLTLVDEILGNFTRVRTVEVFKTIEDFLLPEKKIQPLGLIINELLTNVMKYAFVGRPGGRIWVSLVRKGTGARLTIQDDGTGMPDTVDFERSTGFGLRLLATLTHHLGGTIGIERTEGTTVTLDFPL